MKLVGAGGQQAPHFLFDGSGTIASSTVPQLLLPRRFATSHLIVMNIHATLPMYLEIGSARATATLTNGVVSAITVTNPGFGFSMPPIIRMEGGGNNQWSGWVGSSDPLSPPPAKRATAFCVMTGSAPNMSVASITVENPGANYLVAPYVRILNADSDPNGCADPSTGGGSGILLPANGGSYYLNGTVTTTDAMALFCSGGIGAKFTCKWAD